MIKKCDVVIIGAGAAGMMCAIEAGKRGRKVVLLDHAKKIGEKILHLSSCTKIHHNLDHLPDLEP